MPDQSSTATGLRKRSAAPGQEVGSAYAITGRPIEDQQPPTLSAESGTANPLHKGVASPGEELGSADAITGRRIEGHLRPPTPYVKAWNSREAIRVEADAEAGRKILIHFHFPHHGQGEPAPWLILTTIDSAGSRVPPLTLRTPVAGREEGDVLQPVGLGHGPFQLLVATIARDGLRSPFARIRLPE